MNSKERVYKEIRTNFNVTRAEGSADLEELFIEGYFAIYEDEVELFNDVFEIIEVGAFNNSLNEDIRALWNHESQYVLGRTQAKTIELTSDTKGLYARIKLPNTTYAKDLYELIKRGDVNQCSIGFFIIKEITEHLDNGKIRWRIKEAKLYEISVVTFPAYENTSVQARKKDFEENAKRSLEVKKVDLKKKLEELTNA